MRVELVDIRKHFGPVKANDGISLTVESGAIHGLLGENGAGKTTLMKILSGFQSADSGEIRLDGVPLSLSSPAEALGKGIGMLYQDPLDFGPFMVLDNLIMGRKGGFLLPRRQARKEFLTLAQRFDFAIDPDAQVQSLTVGERQQLEILRLLSQGIQILILDEPTTGISASQKVKLFATLRRLAHEEGKSVLFVSHKLEEAPELCDRVTVLCQGRVSGQVRSPCSADELVSLMFGKSILPGDRDRIQPGRPVLELEDVSIHAYHMQVPNLSLQVHEGEVIGIAGLEGSGQRLMLQACAGLVRPTAGHIRIDGRELADRRWGLAGSPYHQFRRAGVAYVPADRMGEGLVKGLALTEHMVLADPNAPFFIDWGAARQRTAARIGEYRIKGQPDSLVESLSGGNQQRALQALLRRSLRLLLMEHPTRGLDIESAMWIWERLLERRRQGTAIVFSSSDLDEIMDHSDRVIVFSGGRMSAPIDASQASSEQLGYLIGGMSR
jgi:simple sugar transport system ATP-binding protein